MGGIHWRYATDDGSVSVMDNEAKFSPSDRVIVTINGERFGGIVRSRTVIEGLEVYSINSPKGLVRVYAASLRKARN
jgi:hypothetical protein